MPSNKVWRGCLEEFERTHNKYSILFFQVAKQSREYCHNCQNLANVLTWATGPWVIKGNLFSILILWGHSKVVCQCRKCASLKLNASASGSEKVWMKWLKCCAKRFCLCSWNGLRRLREQVAGSGVEILWIYTHYFQVCVNVTFFTLVASPIFHMSLTNWANRCFKTDAMDYDNSDPGNEPIPLDMISQ